MQTIQKLYLEKVAAGQFELDLVQEKLAIRLDRMAAELAKKALSSKSSSLGWMFGKSQAGENHKGLYIWGSVGRGKSMLMDLFFANTDFEPKRRVHFNDFMVDAQMRIQQQRDAYKNGTSKEEDPIPPVATLLAREAALLCFDEFSVNDIADAMILGRLFKGLLDKGTLLVVTTNVAPDDLYKDGLNRDLFLQFIELLKAHCDICELDARTDYRLEKLSQASVYIAPLGERAAKTMDEVWYRLTGGMAGLKQVISYRGREINVPLAVDGIARFSFSDLCEKPLAAGEYLAIAEKYHTIFIENIPMIGIDKRNEAKRFILLIDIMYDRHIKLVISADANPHGLYQAQSGTEAFEFRRTASRLIEIQSVDYLNGSQRP